MWTLLAAAAVVLLVVILIRTTTTSRPESAPALPPPPQTPREILDQRFAAGQIDIDEYASIRAALESPRLPERPSLGPRRPAVPDSGRPDIGAGADRNGSGGADSGDGDQEAPDDEQTSGNPG